MIDRQVEEEEKRSGWQRAKEEEGKMQKKIEMAGASSGAPGKRRIQARKKKTKTIKKAKEMRNKK